MARAAAGGLLPGALALALALAVVPQAVFGDDCPLQKLVWQEKPLVRGGGAGTVGRSLICPVQGRTRPLQPPGRAKRGQSCRKAR